VLVSSIHWLIEEIELIEHMRSVFNSISDNKGDYNDCEMDIFGGSASPIERK